MAYKQIVKSACRTDYETGNFTLKQIGEKRRIPEGVIERWSIEDGWEKGGLKEIVLQNHRAEIIKQLENMAGKDKKTIAQVTAEQIYDMLKADFIRLPKGDKKDTEKEGDGDEEAEEQDAGLPFHTPDYKARDKAIIHVMKILDAYPAQKVEVDIKVISLKFIEIGRKFVPADKLDEFAAEVEAAG